MASNPESKRDRKSAEERQEEYDEAGRRRQTLGKSAWRKRLEACPMSPEDTPAQARQKAFRRFALCLMRANPGIRTAYCWHPFDACAGRVRGITVSEEQIRKWLPEPWQSRCLRVKRGEFPYTDEEIAAMPDDDLANKITSCRLGWEDARRGGYTSHVVVDSLFEGMIGGTDAKAQG